MCSMPERSGDGKVGVKVDRRELLQDEKTEAAVAPRAQRSKSLRWIFKYSPRRAGFVTLSGQRSIRLLVGSTGGPGTYG